MLRRVVPVPASTGAAAIAIPVRLLHSSPRMAQSNPFSAAPADSFQLLPESLKTGEAEDALYDAQVKEIEAWWQTDRYAGIKRPYGAAEVASKRGTQKQLYPSSVMAKKLFNLIKERSAQGEPIHTRSFLPSKRDIHNRLLVGDDC